ncbi:clumping factor B-like [Homarus americanus]|uniref:clumping factor B-like n=1 Tax=Homarus americanus TaxID=6706 RepID=UPI001C47EF33|nr:clumping factor B-like [Homarus americanus]
MYDEKCTLEGVSSESEDGIGLWSNLGPALARKSTNIWASGYRNKIQPNKRKNVDVNEKKSKKKENYDTSNLTTMADEPKEEESDSELTSGSRGPTDEENLGMGTRIKLPTPKYDSDSASICESSPDHDSESESTSTSQKSSNHENESDSPSSGEFSSNQESDSDSSLVDQLSSDHESDENSPRGHERPAGHKRSRRDESDEDSPRGHKRSRGHESSTGDDSNGGSE